MAVNSSWWTTKGTRFSFPIQRCTAGLRRIIYAGQVPNSSQ
jgi:hypothetical protein